MMNQSDYIVDTTNKMNIKYIGTQYIPSKTNVFGTKFVGTKTCFNQPNFKCPFTNTNTNTKTD